MLNDFNKLQELSDKIREEEFKLIRIVLGLDPEVNKRINEKVKADIQREKELHTHFLKKGIILNIKNKYGCTHVDGKMNLHVDEDNVCMLCGQKDAITYVDEVMDIDKVREAISIMIDSIKSAINIERDEEKAASIKEKIMKGTELTEEEKSYLISIL